MSLLKFGKLQCESFFPKISFVQQNRNFMKLISRVQNMKYIAKISIIKIEIKDKVGIDADLFGSENIL